MDRREILERLQVDTIDITTTRADVWSSNVDEGKFRYIVAIVLIGDGSASTTVTIEKKEEDGSYTTKFKNVPIAPADVRFIPERFDVENPILALEGGTNLAFTASSGTPYASVIYYDDMI